MALFRDDIDRLKKGSVTFLYIFVNPQNNLSADLNYKRQVQMDEFRKIVVRNPEYSLDQLVLYASEGIQYRYGKTPQQMLQQIYQAAAVNPNAVAGIGSDPDLEYQKAADRVKSLSTTVKEDGTTKKRNFWKDVVTVIDWIIAILHKLGLVKNPNTYAPNSDDWIGRGKAPLDPNAENPRGWGVVDDDDDKSAFSTLPILAAGGILLFLMKDDIMPDKKPKRKSATKK